MRMLEEEAVAREKSLAEANERVAQLEKSIKDMQRLLELKGVKPPVVPARRRSQTRSPKQNRRKPSHRKLSRPKRNRVKTRQRRR